MKKILFIIAIFSISALQAQGWNSKKIRGNGKLITITRTISNYDEISVGGSFDVVLVKGKEGKITIEGEENVIPYLETEVNGDRLKIGFKRNTNVKTTRKLIVTVPVKSISSVSLGGSGKIISNEVIRSTEMNVNIGGSGNISLAIDVKEVNTKIGGSGDIKLAGKANKMVGSIAGSGSVKAYDLQTKTAKITIAGSGSIRISVENEINSKIVGSGNIYYKGNPPRINTRSMGSGKVIAKN